MYIICICLIYYNYTNFNIFLVTPHGRLILCNVFDHISTWDSWCSPKPHHVPSQTNLGVSEKVGRIPKFRSFLCGVYPLVMTFTVCELENGPVKIVDLSIKNGGFPYFFVGLPEGSRKRKKTFPDTEKSAFLSHLLQQPWKMHAEDPV